MRAANSDGDRLSVRKPIPALRSYGWDFANLVLLAIELRDLSSAVTRASAICRRLAHMLEPMGSCRVDTKILMASSRDHGLLVSAIVLRLSPLKRSEKIYHQFNLSCKKLPVIPKFCEGPQSRRGLTLEMVSGAKEASQGQ